MVIKKPLNTRMFNIFLDDKFFMLFVEQQIIDNFLLAKVEVMQFHSCDP